MTIAAERAILGAVLLAPPVFRSLAADGVVAAWFSDPQHRLIWSAYAAVEAVDVVTVSSHLHAIGALQHAGGFPYLSGLAGAVPSVSNVGSYVATVRDSYRRRYAAERAREVLEAVERGDSLDEIKPLVEAVRVPDDGTAADVGFASIADYLVEAAREDAAREEGHIDALPPMTGLPNLDKILDTWAVPGHRAAIAGRPSMGKTLMCLQVLMHIARTRGPVAFVSRESPVKAIARRIHKIERTHGGWGRATQTVEDMDGRFFIIGPSDARTILDAREQIRRLNDTTPLACIAGDYLQIFDKHTARGREDLDLAEISRVWADLVEEIGTLGIMLAQLNRQVSGRTDKEPQLTDIRECGAFEQDCDSIVMLHRPSYYTGDPDPTAWAYVRKHRDGAVGRAKMTFTPGRWFENAEESLRW
jgi:replicative DNA helicase